MLIPYTYRLSLIIIFFTIDISHNLISFICILKEEEHMLYMKKGIPHSPFQ